jgi:predicted DNA-binding transcriptional regulator AlpA
MNDTICTPDKLLLSADEAAAVLGIGKTLFYSLHSGGRLPLPVKLGRRTLWRVDELKSWTAAGCPNRQKWETMRGQRC